MYPPAGALLVGGRELKFPQEQKAGKPPLRSAGDAMKAKCSAPHPSASAGRSSRTQTPASSGRSGIFFAHPFWGSGKAAEDSEAMGLKPRSNIRSVRRSPFCQPQKIHKHNNMVVFRFCFFFFKPEMAPHKFRTGSFPALFLSVLNGRLPTSRKWDRTHGALTHLLASKG